MTPKANGHIVRTKNGVTTIIDVHLDVVWHYPTNRGGGYNGLDVDNAIDNTRRIFWSEAPFAEWDEVEEARKAGMPM